MTDAWFIYARRGGRIMGAPANWKGWTALLAALAIILLVALAVGRAAADVHPALGFAALFVVIGGGIAGIVRLVIVKGRAVG